MNRAAFFEAANEMLNWAFNLAYTTEAALRDAEDHLCHKQAHKPGFRPSISCDLAAIREKIEEVMTVFDMVCEAAGEEPAFELAFRVIDAPRLVQYELRDRLDGMPWPKGKEPKSKDKS
jgi:hypothetical protein